MRPHQVYGVLIPQVISIHAPRVGCDLTSKCSSSSSRVFQSTHPVWGATGIYGLNRSIPMISIHAPRVGCDQVINAAVSRARFQSTHPVWGATPQPPPFRYLCKSFQSTHPVWGATGCRCASRAYPGDFNPRTPCGVRHALAKLPQDFQRNFNPRTPCGVRPKKPDYRLTHLLISIHAPRVGCDGGQSPGDFGHRDFNPRTPCGVRLLPSMSEVIATYHFNPRTPCGVRQSKFAQLFSSLSISIHAPRVGCDGP